MCKSKAVGRRGSGVSQGIMEERKQLWRPVCPLPFWAAGFAHTLTNFWLAFVLFEPLTNFYNPL